MIAIRNIERSEAANHADELADIWKKTFQDAYGDVFTPEAIKAYGDEHHTLEEAERWLTMPGTRAAMAERDGEVVGFYIVRYVECPVFLPAASAELKQIYVRASEFGQGTAHELFEHARARIKGTGRGWMWLFVADFNNRAKRFYEKLDFARIGPGPAHTVGAEKLPCSLLARCL
ncbi:MAG: GNAT family N-acetyltransferase [Rhodospirillaceae bacterium]